MPDDKLSELHRLAEIGKLSGGFIHDLANHITVMSLSIEAMKKHIKGRDIQCHFSPEKKIKELVELLRYKIEKERVLIHIYTETGARNVRICGSRLRFNQLFSNLISNAMDAGGKNIEIKIKKKIDHVLISVADNGSGINTKIKEKIFEPFFTTKAKDKGMGLGLATVKEIVEKDFSGMISVKSTLGKGSTFSVSIPL
jgi:signal transduction histidine kinase